MKTANHHQWLPPFQDGPPPYFALHSDLWLRIIIPFRCLRSIHHRYDRRFSRPCRLAELEVGQLSRPASNIDTSKWEGHRTCFLRKEAFCPNSRLLPKGIPSPISILSSRCLPLNSKIPRPPEPTYQRGYFLWNFPVLSIHLASFLLSPLPYSWPGRENA